MAICSENLSQEHAVAICRMFFVFVSKCFLVYVSKYCLYESKPFLYVSKTFLIVRFSTLTVFLFVIAMAVMGWATASYLHNKLRVKRELFALLISFDDFRLRLL